MIDYSKIVSPAYVIDEAALIRNLEIIERVRRESGAQVIVALKANATWSIFPTLAAHAQRINCTKQHQCSGMTNNVNYQYIFTFQIKDYIFRASILFFCFLTYQLKPKFPINALQ